MASDWHFGIFKLFLSNSISSLIKYIDNDKNIIVFLLTQIIQLWQKTDFRTVPQPSRDTYIIGGADDIMAQLEESSVTIGTIRGSRYVAPIKVRLYFYRR